MITTSTPYDTYNALDSKSPVFAVEFYDGSGTLDTKFVSNDFADIDSPPGSVEYIKGIRGLRLIRPKIDFKESQLISGLVQIQIADVNSAVTSFLNQHSPFPGDLYVRVKAGFQEMNYADFVNLNLEGSVCMKVTVDGDLLAYNFEVRDNIYSLFRAAINGNSTNLHALLAATLTNVEVGEIDITTMDPTDIYAAQADLSNLLDDRTFVCAKIEEEIIEYETVFVDTGAPDYDLETLTRAKGNSAAVQHSVPTAGYVYRGIGFECDPMRIFLHLLTTYDGTNGYYDIGDDDFRGDQYWFLFPNPDGGYINVDFLKWEEIEKLGWKMFFEGEFATSGYAYLFIHEQQKAIQHIADTILKPHGLFLKMQDGKIGVGTLDRIEFYENFSTQFAFNTSNIVAIDDFELVVDEVLFDYTFNYYYTHGSTSKRYLATDSEIANALAPDVVRGSKYVINHPGMVTADFDSEQVYHAIRHRFSLLADAYTVVKLRGNFSTTTVEPGDKVTITWPALPDLTSGDRGWTNRKGMVIGQEFDYFSGIFIHEIAVFDHPAIVQNYLADNLYEVDKVLEASITDKTMTVSATETAATEAADAYYDNSGTTYAADRIIFKFRLTPPAFGGGSDHEILAIKISALDSGPAFLVYDYRRYIRFNPQSSTAVTFDCDLYIKAGSPITPDRVRADFLSTTASASETPTLELIGVWFCRLNF